MILEEKFPSTRQFEIKPDVGRTGNLVDPLGIGIVSRIVEGIQLINPPVTHPGV
jgi:hypothetical protein